MFVNPGAQIPFWFKLWDGNPDRFIAAYVTTESGLSIPDSPYLLTYSGNRGIYTGLGPIMGSQSVVVDYEVYLDEELTQLDGSYLGDSTWVQPPTGGGSSEPIFITLPIKGTILQPQVTGQVKPDVDAQVQLSRNELLGKIVSSTISGMIQIPELEG